MPLSVVSFVGLLIFVDVVESKREQEKFLQDEQVARKKVAREQAAREQAATEQVNV
jgi:heme exporter protein D